MIFLESIIAQLHTPIPLGVRGENLARQIVFDISQWQSMYGSGRVELLHQRQNDVNPYPVVPERDGDKVYWKVRDYDTDQVCHYGKAELRYFHGALGSEQTIVKSVTYRTEVLPALGPPVADVPETEPDWIAQFEETVQNAEEKMQSMSALTAQGQEIQESVTEKQTLIAQSVTDAQTAAVSAALSQDAAAQSAQDAADSLDELLHGAFPLITAGSGNPVSITDGADQLKTVSCRVTFPFRQSAVPLSSSDFITPPVQYPSSTVTVNGVSGTTVFTNAEDFTEGTFEPVTGKLTVTRKLLTLDGVSEGRKFIAKRQDFTRADVYTVAGCEDCVRPADSADTSTSGIRSSHGPESPFQRVRNWVTPPTITVSRKAAGADAMDTAELLIDYHPEAEYHTNSTAGFVYCCGDTGGMVRLNVNSTNFTMPDGDSGTNAILTMFPAARAAKGWALLFDNMCLVDFLPVDRDDWSDYESPDPGKANIDTLGAFRAKQSVITVDPDTETQNPVCFCFDRLMELDTLEKANAWLQAQSAAGMPVEIAYEYTQPAAYQYPAREIRTVHGENTFSADTGTLDVNYHGDPALLYEKIKTAFAGLGISL